MYDAKIFLKLFSKFESKSNQILKKTELHNLILSYSNYILSVMNKFIRMKLKIELFKHFSLSI